MSISPYVMDTLYRHGSIDFVPYDLMSPVNGGFNQQQNPNSFGSAMQSPQMQELQAMSQGPITLYPKNKAKINANTSIQNAQNLTGNYNQINSYNYSTISNSYLPSDSFVASNSPLGEYTSSVVNEIRGVKDGSISADNKDSIRATVFSEEERKNVAHAKSDPKLWPKALVSVGAITLALLVLFKRAGSTSATGGSFWSKLNPLNWFK